MKTKIIHILFPLILLTFNIYGQELNLFTLTARSDKAGFVSLSDIDRLSEHSDSLALPNLNNIEKENSEMFRYIQLSSKYRTRFLTRTNISETDKIFIYSYLKDTLVSIPVNNVKTVAWLNGYTRPTECPCPEYYYQIGFEIDNKFLKGFEDEYPNTLVFIGTKNPFVRNQVKPVVWQEIDKKEFPLDLVDSIISPRIWSGEFEARKSYKYVDEKYQYFIQELCYPTEQYNYDQFGLRLLVIDRKTKVKIFETIFYSGGESSMFADLGNQWTGNLFKNKPPVIFGFIWYSFSCPTITFLNLNVKEIEINCDARH